MTKMIYGQNLHMIEISQWLSSSAKKELEEHSIGIEGSAELYSSI